MRVSAVFAILFCSAILWISRACLAADLVRGDRAGGTGRAGFGAHARWRCVARVSGVERTACGGAAAPPASPSVSQPRMFNRTARVAAFVSYASQRSRS